MSPLTSRQWVQLAITTAVLVAAGLGGVLATRATAPKLAPAVSQPPAAGISAPVTPSAPSPITAFDTAHEVSNSAPLAVPPVSAPDAGAVLAWQGIIAVNDTTGNLRSDLGWRPATQGESVLGVLRCAVATEVKPRPRRVLVAPNSPIAAPTYVWTVCSRGFAQWDSLEAASGGRWPKP
jgi:hypothetical protein